jgi:putative ABC transport system permease protein
MSFLIWGHRRRDEQLDEEMRSHLRMAAQDHVDRGLSREEAEASAVREMGNASLVKEVTRAVWGWIWLERLLQDLRFAGRTLRKDRGFTTVAVLTLALGVGATTAIFSVFNGVLLQPLSYRDPGQLYGIWTVQEGQSGQSGGSGPDLADLHDHAKSLDQVGAALPFSLVFTLGGEPKQLHATAISPDLFPMLGVRPLLGREYLPEEYHIDDGRVILSYDFWQKEFGGDPGIVGRSVDDHMVIGVMPRLPDFFPQTDVWVTLIPDFEFMHWRGNRFLRLFGRLKHGVSPSQAEQELTAILRRSPETPPNMKVSVTSLRDDLVGNKIRPILVLLLAAVGLVLLIASVNVATLLLARSEARRQEIDLRMALGAGRGRLLQQLFTENLALAFLGGALGTVLALGLTRLLLRIASDQLPRNQNISINLNVLAFTLLTTIASSIMFGLAPSLKLIKAYRIAGLQGGPRAAQTLRRPRRNLLIISEVGLSLVLIVASGLLLRSLWKLARADFGFEPEHLLATYMRLPNEDPSVPAFYQRLLAELPVLPGVQAAAVSDCYPGMGTASVNLGMPDRAPDPARIPTAWGCWISADYFRTTGTQLLRGRAFTEHDNLDAPPVAIINQSLASRYWPNQDAIGKSLSVAYFGAGRRPQGSEKLRQIVGVVADVKRIGEPGEPGVYMPFTQDETKHVLWGMALYVRSWGTVDVPAEMRAKIRSLRNDVPVNVVTWESKITQSLAPRRFTLLLLGAFALLALALAAIGIHGVVAYSVSRRTREIGVRMALGAGRESVVRMVLVEILKPVGVGLGVGAIAGLGCSRLIASMLYGTTATDPFVLITCAAIMLVVGLAAAWLPARRAASVNPMEALRSE